jgi:putative polyketide hydroxylase
MIQRIDEPGQEVATSVLVVGGSLVGLSAAVFLAARNVPTLLVERHPQSSPHPRAIGFTTRTMELYRSVGLGPRIPQVPPGGRLRRIRVESLAGAWGAELPWSPGGAGSPPSDYSPCTGAALAQDRLEPILRERAVELGADVRLSTELLGFEQDKDAVRATVQRSDGRQHLVRAEYLVAADGHGSGIREALGIGRSGRGHLRTVRSVIFRAPLDSYRESGFSQFSIEQPGFEAFLTTYADGRWILFFSDDERDEAALRVAIGRAIGRADLPVDIVTTGRFEISALIADRFSEGRVFLAGDAAHTLPPNRGGFGANTGIEDAHNIAWKLAAVTSGRSSASLLATYDVERRPIAWLRHEQIFAREDFKGHAEKGREVPVLDDTAIELGQIYRSSAVVGAGEDLPAARRPDEWSGQPGTRAPHVWIERNGQRQSTLDLFGGGWVLVADDLAWSAAASSVAAALGVDLDAVQLGVDVQPADAVREGLGLRPGGASLVRPDGYVAWRSEEKAGDPRALLAAALERCAAPPSSSNPKPP